jgi:hypothetical protein
VAEQRVQGAAQDVRQFDGVTGMGGTVYIPFKVNSQPGEAGTLWEKMFFYYSFRRDDFPNPVRRGRSEATFWGAEPAGEQPAIFRMPARE